MRIRAKLTPGLPGTKSLVKQYGERLICVRYRYDAERRMRYKTVEIIVSEAPWQSRPRRSAKRPVAGQAAAAAQTSASPSQTLAGSRSGSPAAGEELQKRRVSSPAQTAPRSTSGKQSRPPANRRTQQPSGPGTRVPEPPGGHPTPRPNDIVFIKIDRYETERHTEIKAIGGRWNYIARLWSLRYSKAVELNLERRIVAIALRRTQ